MTIWVDAHLSPAIATWINRTWINRTFGITAFAALWDVGLRDAEDDQIFEAAKAQAVIC
jgi:predicted nuclease of predicted toxin-antitoxin system